MDNNPLHPSIIPLHCAITHHHWGAPAAESRAARLFSLNRSTALSSLKPYSEFIIAGSGPHPAALATAPSVALADHVQAQVIEVNPASVAFYTRLHAEGLPYTLRVASVATPAGLRVHPPAPSATAKKTAHAARPVMLVALNSARLLAAFRPSQAIVSDLLRVPEFADAAGRPTTDAFVHVVKTATPRPSHLRNLLTSLFKRANLITSSTVDGTAEPESPPPPPPSPSAPTLIDSLKRAAARLRRMPEEAVTDTDRDFLALQEAFPKDPMCFAVYLLNRVELKPGSAVFVPPGQPYCLLQGDFVEAAAANESVLYGGLVPRVDDIPAFIETLTYTGASVEPSEGERFSDYGVSFVPPVDEYQMLEFKLPGDVSQQMARTLAPSIVAVLSGEGTIMVDEKDYTLPMRPGSVYYLTPRTRFTVTSSDVGAGPLHMFQIGVNESAAASPSTSCTIM